MAEAFRDSGATLAKPYPELGRWSTIQPEADAPYDWTRVDAFVAAFQAEGFIQLNLMMSAWSDWANVDPPRLPFHRGDSRIKPENEEDFAAYVQAYVERYDLDGQDDMAGLRYPVRLYGLEPEYSSYVAGDAESYLRLLELAYPAIKQAYPDAQLMTAGLLLAMIFDGYPTAEDVAARLAAPDERVFDKSPGDVGLLLDRPDLFDIVDFHSLTDYTEIMPTVAWLRAEMARRGYKKPVWIGDTWEARPWPHTDRWPARPVLAPPFSHIRRARPTAAAWPRRSLPSRTTRIPGMRRPSPGSGPSRRPAPCARSSSLPAPAWRGSTWGTSKTGSR